ncbi:hypothetical protein MNBD_BACTEROID02-102 [hydrothermal vent metagenome]|jgi:hypothetical protein|uniref:Uncharacterized protein n=1 Tax=hydrothermal vent metagenome TaxID=652676 RepID=A0A3B0QQX9_9ZZZZ
MKSQRVLLVLLIIVAIVMIAIGIMAKIPAPALTGIGFIIIALLFNQRKPS